MKWSTELTRLSERQKKLILREVIVQLTKATFGNHFYKWENKIYKQLEGGAISLRATGSIARCIMDIWCKTMKNRLAESKVTTELKKKYVDDVLGMFSKQKLGTRY